MRPYPGQELDVSKRIFSYRLSRARRIVENTFGILSQKFKIYNRRIQAKPENVDYIIITTCILHNFIRKFDANAYTYEKTSKWKWNSRKITLENLPEQGGNATKDAFRIRELIKDYFNSEIGSVSWQEYTV